MNEKAHLATTSIIVRATVCKARGKTKLHEIPTQEDLPTSKETENDANPSENNHTIG